MYPCQSRQSCYISKPYISKLHVSIYIHTHIYAYTQMYAYQNIYAYMYPCQSRQSCYISKPYISKYTCIYIHTYTHMYIYVSMSVKTKRLPKKAESEENRGIMQMLTVENPGNPALAAFKPRPLIWVLCSLVEHPGNPAVSHTSTCCLYL